MGEWWGGPSAVEIGMEDSFSELQTFFNVTIAHVLKRKRKGEKQAVRVTQDC